MKGNQLGLIVNPVAGMGGSVGLKGTDGDLAMEARSRGAVPLAEARAVKALSQLGELRDNLTLLTCAGAMGEAAARSSGIEPTVVYWPERSATTAADSRAGAAEIVAARPDLVLFAGGDGTARDLLPAVGSTIPLLGIPAGVKMHSAVFAASARAAGEVARAFLEAGSEARNSATRGSAVLLRDAEVMDRETDSAPVAQLSPRLYGMVRTPSLSFLVPGAKSSSRLTDEAALAGAVEHVAGLVGDARVSLLGPGSTMQRLKSKCGFEGTPLGVDAVSNGRCLATDLNEAAILDLIRFDAARIVVSVVGGQGFLFGRGNQQLSPRVIEAVGTKNVVVLSSLEKLTALPGQRLLVDTGDEQLDETLAGHIHVRVGKVRTVVMPVRAAHPLSAGD